MLVQGEAEAGDFSAGDFAVDFSRQVKTGLASLNNRERRISPTTPRSTMPPTAPPMATPAISPSLSPESEESTFFSEESILNTSLAVTVGADSTVSPSDSLTAVAEVPKVVSILLITAAAVVPAGKVMVTVIITLAAALTMDTLRTPTSFAVTCWASFSPGVYVSWPPYCRPEPPGRLRSRSVWTVQKFILPEAAGANIAASWARSESVKLPTAALITLQCSAPSALAVEGVPASIW